MGVNIVIGTGAPLMTSAAECLSRARDLHATGRAKTAEAIIEGALQQYPAAPELLQAWCNLAVQRRDWASAAERCREMRARFPEDPSGYVMGVRALAASGEIAAAGALITEALRRFPTHQGAIRAWVDLAMRVRNLPEAVQRWETVRRLLPNIPFGYAGGIRVLAELGRSAEAEALAEQARMRFPADLEVLTAWANAAMLRRDWATAVERWEVFRAQFPERSIGYLRGTLALREARRFAEADALLRAGLETCPDGAELAVAYASQAEIAGDWVEARRRWEAANARLPQQGQQWYANQLRYCKVLMKLRDFDTADAAIEQVMRLRPEEVNAFVQYAKIAQIRNDKPLAVQRWKDLLERFPDYLQGYWQAATAAQEAADPVGADAILEAAIERFPNTPELSFQYAGAARMRLDWAEAVRRWEAARKRFPQHPEGYIGSALALSALKRDEEAEAVLAEGEAKFPAIPRIAVDRAYKAMYRQKWAEAADLFAGLRSRFPNEPAGYKGGAELLWKLCKIEEAEALLECGMALLRAIQRKP